LLGCRKTTVSPLIIPTISLVFYEHFYLTTMGLACADLTTAGWTGSWKTMPTAVSSPKNRYIDYTRPPQLEHIFTSPKKKSCCLYANGERKYEDNCHYSQDEKMYHESKCQKICDSDYDPNIDTTAYNRMINVDTYSDDETNASASEDKREIHYEKNKSTSLKFTYKN
jgi:hypothetical protein